MVSAHGPQHTHIHGHRAQMDDGEVDMLSLQAHWIEMEERCCSTETAGSPSVPLLASSLS